MWVDDTIVRLERGDPCPIQGIVLDEWGYYLGILPVDVRDQRSTMGQP